MGRYKLKSLEVTPAKNCGAKLDKIPPEELGRPIQIRRIVQVVGEILQPELEAKKAVLLVLKSINKFLKDDRRLNERRLSRQLIYSLLLDCLKSELPMSNEEKEERRKFKERLGLVSAAGKKRVCYGKSVYRSEFYWTLMFETGDPSRPPNKKIRFVKQVEASLWVAQWLLPLGIMFGVASRKRRDASWSKSEKHGTSIAVAASSIRKAYSSWNRQQAPNKPLGVYPGKIIRRSNGKREVVCLTDKKSLSKHQWK